MQKWEYCRLLYDAGTRDYWELRYQPTGSASHRIKRDAAKGDADDTAAWWRTIADIGLEGWEMVGAYQDTGGSHHLYFKRPLTELG